MKRQIGFLCLSVSLFLQGSAEQSKSLSPLSKEILQHFYLLWKESGYGYDPNYIETAEWVILNSENNFEFLKWQHSGEKNKESWKGKLPKNLVAQVHTHSVVADPKPSQMDHHCSARINVPIYTISKDGIWKVNPDGKITREANNDWWVRLEKRIAKQN